LWHFLAQEHFIPVTKSGGYTPDNILPLAKGMAGAIMRKANKNAEPWLTKKFGKRKARIILKRIAEYFGHIATSISSDSE